MSSERDLFGNLKTAHFISNRYLKSQDAMLINCTMCGLIALYFQGEMNRESSQAYAQELAEYHGRYPEADIMTDLFGSKEPDSE